MDKEVKDELMNLSALFLAVLIILKIIFYKQDLVTIIKTTFSLFWLFVLPGFALMYYWKENLDFITRLIAGTVLGISVVIVVGYNLGILGISLTIQAVIIPVLCIAIALFLFSKKKSDRNNNNENDNN